jgi:hypothetical protein
MFNPYLKSKVLDKRTGDEFNPSQRAGSKEKVFDAKGQINASTKTEALEIIKGLLDGVHDGTHEIERSASLDIDAAEAESIMREAFSDPAGEGFRQVGQALLNPIKEVIDYEGLARKIWAPRTVKAGEVVRYDKDIFVTAWLIAEDGETPQSTVEGSYVYPPEFEVTAFPSIEIKDKYRAQFDILARIQDRARQDIEHKEDLAAVALLQNGGNTVNTTSFFGTLNMAAFEAMRYQIERHRLICDKFIIHRQEVSDLINQVRTEVDPVTLRELVMAGYIGRILNADIITTAGTNTFEVLAPGDVLAVTAPEYLGGMPVRVELFSEPVNEFVNGKSRQGWFWYELISMVLINPAGVSLGHKV